jgi:hypothetical protein
MTNMRNILIFLSVILFIICIYNLYSYKENYDIDYKYFADYNFGDWSWNPDDNRNKCKGGKYAVL